MFKGLHYNFGTQDSGMCPDCPNFSESCSRTGVCAHCTLSGSVDKCHHCHKPEGQVTRELMEVYSV